MTRLDDLRAILAGSLAADGKPLLGYKQRVVALRAEIARLEGLQTPPAETSALTPGGELP